MSADLLAHLRQWNAFDPHPLPATLGHLHVPFDHLYNDTRVEARLDEALGRGGRVAIIGSSGAGKSSVLAHVLLRQTHRLAPIAVPLSVSTEGVPDPSLVADRLIQEVSEAAREVRVLSEREREATQATRAVERPVTAGRDITASLKLPWLGLGLATDLQRQTQVSVGISAEEKLEVVNQVLVRIAEENVEPVLIFDDTDRWLPGAGYSDATQSVEAFFGRVVPWVGDLGFAVVVACHSKYFDEVAPRAHLLDALDTPIDLPLLPERAALAEVLQRRLTMACDSSEFAGSRLDEAFEADAIDVLFEWYSTEECTVRGVVKVTHIAMIEAADAGLPRIGAASVNAAVASEQP